MTTIADGYFNVMEYGAKGNPYGDDTVAIKAAAQAARATASKWGSKGLYFPPGGAYVCMSPVDFTGISTIKCEGWACLSGTRERYMLHCAHPVPEYRRQLLFLRPIFAECSL